MTKTTLYQSLVQPPQTFTTTVPQFESAWHQPWSEPVRQKIAPSLAIALIASGAFAPVLNPNTQITQKFESKWHQPWSEPVRIRRFGPEQQDFAADFPQPPTPSILGWRQPLSEPVRIKSRIHDYTFRFWSGFTPAAVTVTDMRWYAALSDPVRTRRFGAEQQDFAADYPGAPTLPIFADKWQPQFTDRHKDQTKVSFASFDFMATDESLAANFWYAPWTEPVRVRRLGPEQQDYAADFPQNFAPATFSDTRWYAPLSEPVRLRRFDASQQQSQAFTWFIPPASGLLGNWYTPLADPVRTRQLATAQQAFTAYTWFLPTPASFLEGWYSAFGEPVRQKQGFAAQQQQTQAWGILTPITEVITADKWAYPWSEPVRVSFLSTAQQVGGVWAANKPIVSIGYYSWLSEPVRQKSGLIAALQRETTIAPAYPNLWRLVSWLKPFDLPVWPKKGLLTSLQQYFTAGTKPIANVVTVTMSATETNSDIAQFAATVYNAPLTAAVSIKEIPRADTAYASIEET